MTLEEAIKLLKQYQGYEPMSPDGETLKHSFDLTDETVDTLLTALRPVSREQAEKELEWKNMVIEAAERRFLEAEDRAKKAERERDAYKADLEFYREGCHRLSLELDEYEKGE